MKWFEKEEPVNSRAQWDFRVDFSVSQLDIDPDLPIPLANPVSDDTRHVQSNDNVSIKVVVLIPVEAHPLQARIDSILDALVLEQVNCLVSLEASHEQPESSQHCRHRVVLEPLESNASILDLKVHGRLVGLCLGATFERYLRFLLHF